eukprot:CAMPEP_0201622226 /NCGR_PEP_ID=MMETSP0492-20130828/47294_1 /ASSEMBLY_ACC=CAM_ASM_000837 /TAXON_ID=420259 /ORGANISM="Thalassiosira gravida, Strain GMp14c1" /LENGTH=293 /DNA_ID=CAMNT_0048091809 /DNA_START=143 /DNA_END=1026 /DNA_ORIENTATION=+
MKDRLRSDSLHKKITLLPKLGSEVPPQAKGLKFGIPAIKKQSVARVLRGGSRSLRVTRLLARRLALVEVSGARAATAINAILFAILIVLRILVALPVPVPVVEREESEVSGARAATAINAILFAILIVLRILVALPVPVPVVRTRRIRIARTLARRLALGEVRGGLSRLRALRLRATLTINAILFAVTTAPVPVIRTRRLRVTRLLARRLALAEVSGARAATAINAILFAILIVLRTLVTFQENSFAIRNNGCGWSMVAPSVEDECMVAATTTVEKVRAAKAKAANFIVCVYV